MAKGLYWMAYMSSDGQDITSFSCNLQFYQLQCSKEPRTLPNSRLRHVNPTHILTCYSFTIIFNIITQYKPNFPNGFSSSCLPTEVMQAAGLLLLSACRVTNAPLTTACHALNSTHSFIMSVYYAISCQGKVLTDLKLVILCLCSITDCKLAAYSIV
jgi:hypothetical protein